MQVNVFNPISVMTMKAFNASHNVQSNICDNDGIQHVQSSFKVTRFAACSFNVNRITKKAASINFLMDDGIDFIGVQEKHVVNNRLPRFSGY